jgi:hypothetical protein
VVFRIHFTAEDLARTHIADSPRPLLEANLAVRLLQGRNQPERFGAWRHDVLARLPRRAGMILDLMPSSGYTPMFLNPNRPGDVGEQLDMVRGAPRSEIRLEMARFAQRHAIPAWARGLESDRRLLGCLADALDRVHGVAVAPHWADVSARFVADRSARAQEFLDGGIDRLLTCLHPARIRWVPPVLEVLTVSRLRGELRLDGRGLLLVPTVFGVNAPTIDLAGEQPCLTYPARQDGHAMPLTLAERAPGRFGVPASLVALLGRTRAAVLCAIVERPGCSTGELATAVRVSQSTASEHATVLRTAGLISTVRHRQKALHTPTAAGSALLAR